jgi:carboxymethylenebutenolidase
MSVLQVSLSPTLPATWSQGDCETSLSMRSTGSATVTVAVAGLDERVNATAEAWQAALKAAGVDFAAFTYPNVNHAFNNDTSAARYNKEAATLAWSRTLAWLAL